MDTSTDPRDTTTMLIDGLRRFNAYSHDVDGAVAIHQTHISIIALAGDYAYKIKKPIKTNFLDYSTLELRKHFCDQEVRLDRRFADDLYLGVVPITIDNDQLTMDGDGEIIEYAVKMRRFPDDALVSNRSDAGRLTTAEVIDLAETVAGFHAAAAVDRGSLAKSWPDFLVRNFHEVIETLRQSADQDSSRSLKVLHDWTNKFFGRYLGELADRVDDGFIRECHGDLHLANVVHWGDRLIPFDGIEFNDHLRWIDVLSDAAFLSMDLVARGHLDLSRTFTNAYLERTGDYRSLELWRLFLVYRSLVRALAASMRSDAQDVHAKIDLAYRFTLRETPQLWITRGVSGSGKTTLSEAVVQRHEAIRLRSDIERKRLFGLAPNDRPSPQLATTMYSDDATEQTYRRLGELAGRVLDAGYSVIVDATFLRRSDRDRFHDLANQHGVGFAILDCHSDPQTLRQRVADRASRGDDASDADLRVLENQLAHQEPLSPEELRHVVDVPDTVQIADSL
jgi:uncharacterized protein